MSPNQHIYLLGCASGLAGADIHSGDGPLIIKESALLQELNLPCEWVNMLKPLTISHTDVFISLNELYFRLAQEVACLMRLKKFPLIIGGDHACAIGTWSGVYESIKAKGDLGLIWIDAHMDSHTPETSLSGHIHGMPLAALLGYGNEKLTDVLSPLPKLKPHNICLIGVRSYESGEAQLLKSLNVKIYFMEEVLQRGMQEIILEAQQLVSARTIGYGLSLDLDAIDPQDAPGVDVPEPNGILFNDLINSLKPLIKDPKLLAAEIVEFDPTRDREKKTEKIAIALIELFTKRLEQLQG